MTVFLVRHAVAVGRGSWDGHDHDRPLSGRGRRQAAQLAGTLGRHPVARLLSSPAVRCMETLAPLSEAVGRAVEVTPALLEGADPTAVVRLLDETVRTADGTVLCTHGDLVPEVLRSLAAAGVAFHDPPQWEKGSVWVLDGGDVHPTRARYLPPPC